MQQWLRANGGPYALMFFGIAVVSTKALGAIIFLVGFLLWLNDRKWIPVRAVRRFDLDLAVSDLVFTVGDGPGPGRIQVLATIINRGGAATILHSWTLELRLPGRVEPGAHLPDAEPINTTRPSLSDATSVVPISPGTLRGFVLFGLVRFSRDDQEAAMTDGVLKLSVTDQSGKVWTFEQSVAEIVSHGVLREPVAGSEGAMIS